MSELIPSDVITKGDPSASIYVICEPPTEKCHPNNPTNASYIGAFLKEALKNGFSSDDFYFIRSTDTIPVEIKKSKSKVWKHVEPYAEKVRALLANATPSAIIAMGDIATRVASGRAVSITKAHGTLTDDKIYPMYSLGMCLAYLENMPVFEADMATFAKLKAVSYNSRALGEDDLNRYWCTDIQHILDLKPQIVAIDTETTGIRTTEAGFTVLTAQICYNNNDCAIIPLTEDFWPGEFDHIQHRKLLEQFKTLCADPSILKVGQNINYERLALATINITINAVLADCMILAWAVDENQRSKDLDSLVRRYVPELAGLNDHWNGFLDKSNMRQYAATAEGREAVRQYAGNDGVMTRRLFYRLWNIIKNNPSLKNLMMRIKMPGLYACFMMEQRGILVDQEYMQSIKGELREDIDTLYAELIEMVPRAIIRQHLDNKKKLKFSRADFIRDILFSDLGFNLTPVVFTATTKDARNTEDKIASTSAKDHLPYFKDLDGAVGEFVTKLIEYNKLQKLLSTYVESFYGKYVHEDGAVHSKFNLHITTTGRTSSSGPNAQNYPSRGKWSKKYKKSFVARPGYKFISCDLSQIELRLIAWESQDPVMLKAYRDGKDIHQITAQAVLGLSDEEWALFTAEEKKLARFRAKAVNFGFCYGMRAKKFRSYAKTDYDLTLSEREAMAYYRAYHNLYRGIIPWHERRIREVRRDGQVTSLHGVVRHLPSIFSPDSMIQNQSERQAVNTNIQGLGSDLGLLAIARLVRQCDPDIIRPVAFIHDDVILEVKDGHEQDGLSTLLWVMNNPPIDSILGLTCPVPILGEPDIGVNLGEMYELSSPPKDPEHWVNALDLKMEAIKPTWWQNELDIGYRK